VGERGLLLRQLGRVGLVDERAARAAVCVKAFDGGRGREHGAKPSAMLAACGPFYFCSPAICS
jgi:hypothetical protein